MECSSALRRDLDRRITINIELELALEPGEVGARVMHCIPNLLSIYFPDLPKSYIASTVSLWFSSLINKSQSTRKFFFRFYPIPLTGISSSDTGV